MESVIYCAEAGIRLAWRHSIRFLVKQTWSKFHVYDTASSEREGRVIQNRAEFSIWVQTQLLFVFGHCLSRRLPLIARAFLLTLRHWCVHCLSMQCNASLAFKFFEKDLYVIGVISGRASRLFFYRISRNVSVLSPSPAASLLIEYSFHASVDPFLVLLAGWYSDVLPNLASRRLCVS